MKGLLLKDFLNLKKYGRSAAFILAFFILISALTKDSEYLIGMMVLMFTIMAITSFSYDDLAKWDMYAVSMPVSRRQIVKSKYILAVLLAVTGALLSIAFNGVVSLIEKKAFLPKLLTTYAVFALAVIYICILIPLIYKFGVEKSRVFMIAVFAIPTAVVLVMNQVGIPMPKEDFFYLILNLSPAILLLTAVLSYAISCRVFGRKEF